MTLDNDINNQISRPTQRMSFQKLGKKMMKFVLSSIESLVQQTDLCGNRTALVYPTGKLFVFYRYLSS